MILFLKDSDITKITTMYANSGVGGKVTIWPRSVCRGYFNTLSEIKVMQRIEIPRLKYREGVGVEQVSR